MSSSRSSSKPSTKPSISSSPNRAEKFQPPPPPLTRFLRGKSANRSRGRSLSSPMFSSVVRKKKSDIETQEPSSPKVTCIGQVRVKRSSSKQAPTTTKPKPTKRTRGCKWLQRVLFCSPFARKKPKPRSSGSTPVWFRWFAGYHQRKVPQDKEEKEAAAAAKEEEEEERKGKEGEESKVFVPLSPPKNALLLMRCRSEPRGSGTRLGISVTPTSLGQKEGEHEVEEEDEEKVAQLGVSSRPLILTRCKSEPASKTGGKIGPLEEFPQSLTLI